MCLACLDADERKEVLINDDCDGVLVPFMTVEELKTKMIEKWHRTKKTCNFIYKEAIINAPDHPLEWIEVFNNQPTTLRINFINL